MKKLVYMQMQLELNSTQLLPFQWKEKEDDAMRCCSTYSYARNQCRWKERETLSSSAWNEIIKTLRGRSKLRERRERWKRKTYQQKPKTRRTRALSVLTRRRSGQRGGGKYSDWWDWLVSEAFLFLLHTRLRLRARLLICHVSFTLPGAIFPFLLSFRPHC